MPTAPLESCSIGHQICTHPKMCPVHFSTWLVPKVDKRSQRVVERSPHLDLPSLRNRSYGGWFSPCQQIHRGGTLNIWLIKTRKILLYLNLVYSVCILTPFLSCGCRGFTWMMVMVVRRKQLRHYNFLSLLPTTALVLYVESSS